ncbi:50S ribosomal protein L25 [Populibacterium corticicola]|jgi:large subunit ribosomal protein L25|uniref:50S ribosomal protein L25 n=1 Tax=Populibacterium corticicola TaxID=1812826 RepID=A0ABW5XK05_9MICO
MANAKLVASARSAFGKGAARQARRDGQVPSVLYSAGSEAQHIVVDAHEAFLVVKNNRTETIDLEVDGKVVAVSIKDVQRDSVGRVIEHIDFFVA